MFIIPLITISYRTYPKLFLQISGSTYLGQVGTLAGWTTYKDNVDTQTCRPRKLGLPILGRNECIKSGINPAHLNDNYGCVGIVNTNSLVCGVSELYTSYYDFT